MTSRFDGTRGSMIRENGPMVAALLFCIVLAWLGPRLTGGLSGPAEDGNGQTEIGAAKVEEVYSKLGGEAGKAPVVMFSTSWCPVCTGLQKELKRQGIPFLVVDVEKDELAARYFIALVGASSGVPVTLAGSKVILGFQPDRIRTALGLPV